MTTKEISQNFNKTLSTWKQGVSNYSNAQFAMKPAEDSWSAGQVCQHLLTSTRRVFIVIEKCLKGEENANELKTEAGEKAFKTNILSEVKVKLPLSIQATPELPESREAVLSAFEMIQKDFEQLAEKIEKNNTNGKEKHPVLGYLNAIEWLQAVEMHFRHHLQQKEGIDAFLRSQRA